MSESPDEKTYRRILALRAVRHFLPHPIPDAGVERILEAGRWTGSSKNTQPWAFVVATDDERRAAIAAAGRFTAPLRVAPLVVALVLLPGGTDFDIGRLAQNMMLAADAVGVGSVPVTLHDEGVARGALGLPAGHRCRYAIGFGYVDRDAHREVTSGSRWIAGGRRPLDELVHRDRFTH